MEELEKTGHEVIKIFEDEYKPQIEKEMDDNLDNPSEVGEEAGLAIINSFLDIYPKLRQKVNSTKSK